MENNDNVPIGVAYAIFAMLGVLIIGSFVFAGWSILQLRNNIVNAGKILEAFDEAPPEFGQRIYEPITRAETPQEPDGLAIIANGQRVQFENGAPASIDNTMFVPINGVFEALGYAVSWDEDANVAMFSGETNTIIITMDEETFTVNNEIHTFNVPAQFTDEVAMFPIRPVVESLDYSVAFNRERNALSISSRPSTAPEPAPEPTPAQTPRPAAPRRTPEPSPEPPAPVACHTCHTSGIVSCASCNGIGGGRGAPFNSGIPHEISPTSDVWWCTVCNGRAVVTCRTCSGSGVLVVAD